MPSETVASSARENLFLDLSLPNGELRLSARRIGDAGRGPTLVFLHEALGSIGQWKGFPEDLAAASGLPALVYERQGHGRSAPLTLPRPGDYLRHEAEVVLPAVLAASGIEHPVLFGHSDGATIALMCAAAFPEQVAACIVLAPHVTVEEVTLAGIRAAEADPRAPEIRRRLARYHGDGAEDLWRAWTETWLRPGFDACEMRADLPRIACPVLAIQGEDDAYGSADQIALIAAGTAGAAGAAGPVETVFLPACGHQPHLEQRPAVLEAAGAFLARAI
ncbi:alpha/beta hydrolase [Pelagibius sp. CAU 1746]|uniref:alpha/beta fold hydrolase n=1 Tax=Pelagibius sp. CAU 1746 TaxID=3140370 RepID=UPI00325B05FB